MKYSILGLVLGLSLGCGSNSLPIQPINQTPANQTPATPVDTPLEPGVPIPQPGTPITQQALTQKLQQARAITQADFDVLYDPGLTGQLSYNPSSAVNLSTIQQSQMALNQAELDALQSQGFVITDRSRFPSFLHGYETLYFEDLPLYVSADSLLHALHSSYDNILKNIELFSLITQLENMLETMTHNLAQGRVDDFGAQTVADLDIYLTLARSLLKNQIQVPLIAANLSTVTEFFNAAQKAEGLEERMLFGVGRKIDFSQFEPRGHYTDEPILGQYFRAMMWLGRIDFRIIEVDGETGQPIFHRPQLLAAAAMTQLLDSTSTQNYRLIDNTIRAFVGEPDNMTVEQMQTYLADLSVSTGTELAALTDEVLASAIQNKDYGAQKIASHVVINGLGSETLPLSHSFRLLGQRYVLDSHVFSNLVYDRVQGGNVKRMMPDPLDAAFAALGNNQAATLLKSELQTYTYAPDLHAMRILADAHGADFWQANLYNEWLTALRNLSPTDVNKNPSAHGLPTLLSTEAWGRRILNAQMASWAELRHDTLLYAKQSYTGGISCEFPDAYVEPYPAFYKQLDAFALHAARVVADLPLEPWLRDQMTLYFDKFSHVVQTLGEMAQLQVDGLPYEAKHLAFINQAVRIQNGCGEPEGAEGWFAELYFDKAAGAKFDPTIADVHTQPTDASGVMVGKVLHVGTGMPRLMVVSIETCTGVRAYAGLASSYFEHTTDNFQRLNDEDWGTKLQSTQGPDEVRWMQDLVVH